MLENLQSKHYLNWIIYMNTQNKIHMEFTKLELELMRYAMYDLLNADGNRAALKCEQIITKIDKIVDNIK